VGLLFGVAVCFNRAQAGPWFFIHGVLRQKCWRQEGIGYLIMQSTNILDAKKCSWLRVAWNVWVSDGSIIQIAVSKRLRRYMLEVETI
jgi:hypothetical protein